MHRLQGEVKETQCSWHAVLVGDEGRGEINEPDHSMVFRLK